MRRNRKLLWSVVTAYLTRWLIKEAIRVLTCARPLNLVVLVNALVFFTAVVLGTRIRVGPLSYWGKSRNEPLIAKKSLA